MDNRTIQTKIGKDVIDSITLSMYEDPRIVYREYIQNSADQIDIAVENGILEDYENGIIEILIDKNNRSVSIEDNATGIESSKVENVLKNIAQSSKKRDKNKGFRGIGRLGGIAYCDKLVFETSFKGEKVKSILTWDSLKLKQIINDRSKNEEATEVIDLVTNVDIVDENENAHYFKVTLRGVNNESLLSVEDVREYLSMVAPVQYQRHFIFKDLIYEQLKNENITIDEYNIFINNDKLEKVYTTSIYEGIGHEKKKIDQITELKFFPVRDIQGDLLAYGWYGISNFEKQIPPVNIARGIRLRKGNIQIGTNDTLIKFFKEQRGNNYFFGEIFILDKELIPNARRDYFVENESLKKFEIELTKVIKEPLHKLYYFASNVRSASKKIEQLNSFKDEFEKKSNQIGFSNKEEKEKYVEKFEQLKEKAIQGEKELKRLQERIGNELDPKNKIFENIVVVDTVVDNIKIESEENKDKKVKYSTDDLSKLKRDERKLMSKVFGVIDIVLTPDLAENLKEKIKTEFR
ncbi:ATP-binding protein [Chryseobacterium gambrini]|uniref:ATP-binding protein n=1 Tax=Chryseobacterium gambrini TaxID=373672 RepID=A0ABN7CHQ1_9FLAO|nr:ATP-binding protein [Chryseobacterium gambrini]